MAPPTDCRAVNRRRLLRTTAALSLPLSAAGCAARPPVADGGDDTDGRSPSATTVSVVDPDDQPDVPVEYGAEMAEPTATDDHPARLRVTLRNPTDETVALGEERAVVFHHVTSDDALYLLPAGDHADDPVEPGCWRLTEGIAIATYYGTLSLDPGERLAAESHVYGHPGLPEGDCLPAGDHRVVAAGRAGGGERAVVDGDAADYEWGFTLRVDPGA
jgi:hypothetical protein